jgi:hypothetical protein
MVCICFILVRGGKCECGEVVVWGFMSDQITIYGEMEMVYLGNHRRSRVEAYVHGSGKGISY